MRITDINCMIGCWPESGRYFTGLDTLFTEMDKYRLTECVAFHSMSLWSPRRGNSLMKQISESSSGRVKPCYVLEPNLGSSEMPEAAELKRQLIEEKPSAVRLYPSSKKFYIDEFYCGELLEVLSELGIPIILEADQIPSFNYLPALAKAYPKINFIILRHGINESRFIIPLIKKLDNVFFDTSIMVDTGIIEEIVNKYGSEKLLFGSGLPRYVPTGVLSLIIYARINEEDKEKILSKNWLRIQGGIQCK